MKTIFIVMDGAGDRPDKNNETPLSRARKPSIDSLARKGRVGLLDMGYQKGVVNSDFGFLNLLGCYSKSDYPGRGYLEALGAGLEPGPKDLCIRCNFATLDSRGNIVDRRAGRDETGLREFSEKLDGMEIDGVEFHVRKSTGHRFVLLVRGRNISDAVVPNDPLKEGVPLPQVTAKKPEAKFTASVLNKFVYRSRKMLSSEPLNKKRQKPANTVLLRNIGKKGSTESFKDRFGMKACCIAGVAIAKGVSRFLGMDVIDVKGATGMPDTNLKGKADAAIRALKDYDFVWVHINGTDILSHDRKRKEKIVFIEKVDQQVVSRLLKASEGMDTLWVITCDHRTVSLPKSVWDKYEHVSDPVPVMVCSRGLKSEGRTFSEKECGAASMRFEGNDLLPMLLRRVASVKPR